MKRFLIALLALVLLISVSPSAIHVAGFEVPPDEGDYQSVPPDEPPVEETDPGQALDLVTARESV